MDEIKEFKEMLANAGPEEWKDIPDIDLYMDQVISYMARQHIGLGPAGDETLTSAMINNYIKSGIMPRAKGKKYNREHIAYLTSICLLKQVLSVSETGFLLERATAETPVEDLYKKYRENVKKIFSETADGIDPDTSEDELLGQAVRMAVVGYANIICCKKIIDSIK